MIEERMMSVYQLLSVLWVCFSALMMFIGWWEGQ